MDFTFFHGTSTIFLDSIRKHGLGTINPNTDLKNLEVLKVLFELSEQHLNKNLEYLKIKDTTRAMVYQTATQHIDKLGNKIILNYRHDGMYVSLSRSRAAIYAVLGKYGSEILERCIELFKLLNDSKIQIEIPLEIDIFNFRQYIDVETKPIIVEVKGVLDDDLEKEDGKTAKEALSLIRGEIPTLTEKDKFEFLQFCNFKLLKPVAVEQLRFYEIDYEGHPHYANFEFTLSRI